MADCVLSGFRGCSHGQGAWGRRFGGKTGYFFFSFFWGPGVPLSSGGGVCGGCAWHFGCGAGFLWIVGWGGTLLAVLFWWGGVPVGVLCAVWVLGICLCIFYYICSGVLGCYLTFGIAYRSVSPHGVNIVSLIVFYITVVLLVVVKEIFGTNLVASGERIFVGSDYRFLSIS